MIEFFCLKSLSSSNSEENDCISVADVASFVFYLLMSSYALYLSWSCNSAKGVSVLGKLFYGFFAFNFGIVYLIFYMIFVSGTCAPSVRVRLKNLTCSSEEKNKCMSDTRVVSQVLSFILYLIISVYALYLSWTCNTIRGLPVLTKAFYGFFAFNFGSLYLIFYLFFIYGTCIPTVPQ